MTYYAKGQFIDAKTVAEIEAMAKFATQEVKDAFRAANKGGAGERAARMRAFIANHPVMSNDEFERALVLKKGLSEAKGAHIGGAKIAALDAARESDALAGTGLDAKGAQERAERDQLEKLRRLLRDVIMFQSEVASALRNLPAEVFLTEDEKADAVDRWNEEREFSVAKKQFKEALSGLDSAYEKAELRARFPEFC